MEARRIEWPPESGLYALYTPSELRIVADLTAAAERGRISENELRRQVAFIHDAKALLDATLREMPSEPLDYEPAPADSPFRMPAAAERERGLLLFAS